MQIGQLARTVGVTPDTIRFYEKEGVLPAPDRARSHYRRYGSDDVLRLRFVLRAKALGFTLAEITELLGFYCAAGADTAQVRALAQERLIEVEEKLRELTRLRDGLRELVAACPGEGNLAHCPIVSALAGDAP